MTDHDADLKAKLAAAKARLQAVEAESKAFDEAEALPYELERTERDASDLEAFTAARKQFGSRRVAMVKTDLGAVIVKAPNEVAFKEWSDSDVKGTIGLEKLAMPCVVYPSPDPKKDPSQRLEKILSELPATVGRLADAVCVLAGWRRDDLAKKP